MVNVLRLFRLVAALAISLCCLTVQAGPYSAIYAFGDSLSDVGNDLIVTTFAQAGNPAVKLLPAPTIYTDGTHVGRFTNGLNYLDGLASSLGLGPLAPSLAGGTVYAYGGARTTYAAAGLPAQASFVNQITAFDATHTTPGSADSSALYVLWIGANDMADAIGAAAAAPAQAGTIVGAAVANAMNAIANAIGNLASLGAKHFLVPNIPDLSLTPLINDKNSAALSGLASVASAAFNNALANTLDLGLFAALDIRELDVADLLDGIVAGSPGNGFANVKDSCYKGDVDGSESSAGSGTGICGNPGSYVFWDYEHPTAATHALLAQSALAAVPEPPAIWMLVFAMAGLATFMRRRHALR